MRSICLALLSLGVLGLSTAAPAQAQQPPTGQQPPPGQPPPTGQQPPPGQPPGPKGLKDPRFEFGKDEAVKDPNAVEWRLAAQGGVIVTTGNAEIVSISGGLNASRKAGHNKLQLDANGTYVRTNEVTTAQGWLAKGRYDRFLTRYNSLYLTGFISADEPAGKELVGGAQTGYSRLLFRREAHELVGETGYDFSYEVPVAGDGTSIHSARFFVGYHGKIRSETGVSGSVEVLANLNSVEVLGQKAGALEDTRIYGTAALTTMLLDTVSFRFSVTAKYDNVPLAAEKLDTKTEATIVVTLL